MIEQALGIYVGNYWMQSSPAITEFLDKVAEIHQALNIPKTYAEQSGMPLQLECDALIDCPKNDVFGRPIRMEKTTYKAWTNMQKQAQQEGVELQIVSAFRSVEYQAGLLEKKVTNGQLIEKILEVNAAPGYSEHHTGCALDITTPGYAPLEEKFEESKAFRWLCENAFHFGFSMTYPRDNPYGVLYEPWHWKFTPT